MKAIKNGKLLLLISVFSLVFLFAVNNLTAGEMRSADQEIIDAGIKKAKELGLNPVPMCEDDNGSKYIPAGYIYNISNNGFSLANGDMFINVTKGELTAGGVKLQRGEYAVIKNDKVHKGGHRLVPEK